MLPDEALEGVHEPPARPASAAEGRQASRQRSSGMYPVRSAGGWRYPKRWERWRQPNSLLASTTENFATWMAVLMLLMPRARGSRLAGARVGDVLGRSEGEARAGSLGA